MTRKIPAVFLAFFLLFTIFQTIPLAGATAEEWLNPDGFDDPIGVWSNEANAYDDNTGSYTQGLCYAAETDDYLILTISSPVVTDTIRFNVWIHAYLDHCYVDVWDIDASSWVPVYDGLGTGWVNATFTERTIDKIKINFSPTSGDRLARIYEVDFGNTPQDEPPQYANVADNGVTQVGATAGVSSYWTDDVGLDTVYLEHNKTGTPQNVSITVSGAASWANGSIDLPYTAGLVVAYRYFCNDTVNNWNVTGYGYITTTAMYLLLINNNATRGAFYVDGINRANGTLYATNYNQTVNLAGVPAYNYTFSSLNWTASSTLTNPYSFTTAGNDTITLFLAACGTGGETPDPGPNYTPLVYVALAVAVIGFAYYVADSKIKG